MNEEHEKELPTPPRFPYKGFKFLTLIVFFAALFFFLGFSGLQGTSSSKFCSSCHEMKPEYYTTKASSHNEVDCVSCHTDPVFKNLAKDKAEGLLLQLKNQSSIASSSVLPIRMTKDVPDSACEKCHNMKTRQVTPSGDLIIPHNKHLSNGVGCTQCHSGVAHGKIADRKMTYQTDLSKWDESVGIAAMADLKFVRPDMDTCIECHKARQVSIECKTCHTTGMVPKSHKQTDFKTKTHGIQAGKNLQKCNQCHKDMSTVVIEGFDDVSPVTKVLNPEAADQKKKTQFDYAKENTFCKKCHSTRPPSHTRSWMNDHGNQAKEDKQKCLACHNYQQTGGAETSTVACSSCHPAIHKDFNKKGHPVPLSDHQRVTAYCYTCHVKRTCSACHKE